MSEALGGINQMGGSGTTAPVGAGGPRRSARQGGPDQKEPTPKQRLALLRDELRLGPDGEGLPEAVTKLLQGPDGVIIGLELLTEQALASGRVDPLRRNDTVNTIAPW